MEYKTDKRALSEFIAQAQRLIGSHNVLDFSLDRDTYCDQFAFDPATHRPAGALAPANAEEVRSLVQLANRTGTPLWPISRGKNLGYGGSAPRLKDIIVLDLSRLNRIIEIDTERGYCVVEPGVSFFDLYDRLKAMGMPLWMSVPEMRGAALPATRWNEEWGRNPMVIMPRQSVASKSFCPMPH